MSCSTPSFSIPAVLVLIGFLSYPSQYLLHHLGPRPLESSESILFNCSVALLLVSYWRSIRADPGRVPLEKDAQKPADTAAGRLAAAKRRWCRVCESPKPPRAHHCKVCKRYAHSVLVLRGHTELDRCIYKMDHHCVWISNCVGYSTFPHFVRFLFYCVTSMSILEYHLAIRCKHIWDQRHLSMVRIIAIVGTC
jgi:palmitoyltransferase